MFRNCNCSYNNLSNNTDTNSSTSNNMYEESCNMIQNYNYGNITAGPYWSGNTVVKKDN